jgi:hypothetical protein
VCATSSCSVDVGAVASGLAVEAAVALAPHIIANSPTAEARLLMSTFVVPVLDVLPATLKVPVWDTPLRLMTDVTKRSAPVSAVAATVCDPVVGASL